MARPTTKLSLMFFSFLCAISASTTTAATNATVAANSAANFITTSCRITKYHDVCVKSLIQYSSIIQKNSSRLAMMALSVSVESAQSTKSFIANLAKSCGLKPTECAALKDCLEVVSDSVDRLNNSASELNNLGLAGSPEFKWHMSNLQTWVSAALTDEITCTDGFSGRALSDTIKSSVSDRITNVAQVTSNALALCNKLVGN